MRAPRNFLFPVTALSRVFREKYIDALQAAKDKGRLDLGGQPALATAAGWNKLLQALRVHQWVVYAKHPFAEPTYLLRYLGRYVNRIAIANHRIRSIDGGVIAFTY